MVMTEQQLDEVSAAYIKWYFKPNPLYLWLVKQAKAEEAVEEGMRKEW